jgi:predicted ATPase
LSKIIITGGPGAGKTSLLEALRQRNYRCSAEVSRQLIMETMEGSEDGSEKGSDCLPWKDMGCFARRVLQRMEKCWREERHEDGSEQDGAPEQEAHPAKNAAADSGICFFDRGIPDIIAYLKIAGLPVTAEFEEAVRQFRYADQVFILPPWEEIYTPDSARWQTFGEAVAIYQELRRVYRAAGYTLTELPPGTVEQRADIIVKALNL